MTAKRVLVVDDSPTQSLRTKLILEAIGFEVMEANNGKAALDLAIQEKPDVVISDILMPEMDGFELCHLIRTNPELQHIPVILQTASYRAKEDRQFGLDIGADAFIPKGASVEEMEGLVNQVIAQSLKRGAAGAPGAGASREPFDALHAQRMLFRLLEETAKLEQANAAIKAERNRAQKYLDVASVMMVAFDREGKITMINPRGCRVLGVDALEAIDADWFETFVPARQRAVVKKNHQRILANRGEKLEYAEYTVLTRGGEERLVAWHNTLLTDDAGEISGILSSGEDITERKKAEEKIRYSEAELRKAQAYAHIGSWIWDIEVDRMEWSDEMYRILGVSREMTGNSFAEMMASRNVYPEDVQTIEQLRLSIIENKKLTSAEFRVVLPSHAIRYVWMEAGELILDDYGQPAILKGTLQDVTERKMAEIKIRESEEKYRSLFENVPDGVYRITPGGWFLAANPGLVRMLGYRSEKELQKIEFADLLFDPQEITSTSDLVEKGLEIQNLETRLKNKKGQLVVALNNSIPVKNEDGEILYYEGTLTNITKLKQAEAELASLYRSEQQRVQRLSLLQRISGHLAGIHSQPEVMQILAVEARELADSLVCTVLRVDEENDVAVVVAQWGSPADAAAGSSVSLGAPVFRQAIQTGKPAFVDEIEQGAPELHQLHLHPDIHAIQVYPISQEGKILGFILQGSSLAQSPAEGEVAAMELLAERAAVALDNARLFEEINSSLQRLAALRSIDQAITSSMNINFTLGVLLDQVVNQLKVHAADILLLDQGAASFHYGAGRGFNVPLPQHTSVGISNSFAGRAVLDRQTIHVPNLGERTAEFQQPAHFIREGFVALFCTPLIAKGQVKGVLEVLHREPLKPGSDWLSFLETLAGQAAIAIDNAELFTNLQRSNADLSLAYDATIQGWSDALDLRDKETEGHTQRVTEMTLRLAELMGIGEREMVHLRRGALLHDIGKMGIPDSILLKPGPLTDEEWKIMRQHPVFAHDLISPIIYLRPAMDIPFCHHEKWDGTGYPQGLKGEQIPLPARIFAIVDVWDALTSDRPYRRAWTGEKTLGYIQEQKGTHFDPQVVDTFLQMISTQIH